MRAVYKVCTKCLPYTLKASEDYETDSYVHVPGFMNIFSYIYAMNILKPRNVTPPQMGMLHYCRANQE